MDDVIYRQAAIDTSYPFDDSNRNLGDALEDIPPADVRENIKAYPKLCGGEHEGATMWFECSHCGQPVDLQDDYCKHCGAVLEMAGIKLGEES